MTFGRFLTAGRSGLAVAFVTLTLRTSLAYADNPLNSSEKPGGGSTKPQPVFSHNDFTIVPVAGGSTDIGFGGGFFSALTQNQKGYDPFVWNLEAAGFVSFSAKEGKVLLPYIDFYSKLTVIRLFGSAFQFDLRPSFTDEQTLYYFGLGNTSRTDRPAGTSLAYFQYGRIHPSVVADLRFKFVDHVAGKTGIRYTHSWLSIPANTKLDEDIRFGSPAVKSLIGTTAEQAVLLFRYGLQFDNRDNEVTPHLGTFDEFEFKWSPGGHGATDAFPFRYGEVSANLRGYVPIFSRSLTLAARVVGDVLFGAPPFYELSRFEDTYAVGGSNGVRGVPGQRYYGKIKVFGNIELRARLFDFHLFGKPMTLGFAGFFDGGRVWADTKPHPELDGTRLAVLHYGVGGGPRVMSGTAFVLRADVAWSPDALPIGAYVSAGEMF
ncbi:MAG: outer membrane protein assembly factor [Myxococcota bacterium]|nr:outer membrane protein assembly factor [Myxococcota bacterium]